MIDSQTTLVALVDEGLASNHSGLAMSCKYGAEWRETTTDEFAQAAREIGLGLYALGVRHGDSVAIHSENRTEWLMADLGSLSIGAVSVPVYATQPADQIKYILEHAEATALFVSTDKMWAASGQYADEFSDMHLIGFDGEFHDRMMTLADLRKKGAALDKKQPELFDQLKAALKPSDIASITYTSGTTGVPKGVMLSHSNLCHTVLASKGRSFYAGNSGPDDRVLSFLPLAHIFEHASSYGSLYLGIPMYMLSNVDTLLEDIQYVKPVHFATVPRLLEKIYGSIQAKVGTATGLQGKIGKWALGVAAKYEVDKAPGLAHKLADKLVFSKFRALMGGNIQGITSGGAALSPDICKFFCAIGVPVGEGYGLTETSPGISVYVPDQLRPGSVGKPLPEVEVKIAEDGEILARGPNIMQGYLKMPKQTAEVINSEGWFHTGDIGHLDEDGFLFITDRKKELFKLSTGKYVAPAPVENQMIASPYIDQVVVVGNSQKFCGAIIHPAMDMINGTLGDDVTDEQIHALITEEVIKANEGLSHWEQVKKFALISDPMTIETGELTPTMKRKRTQINKMRKVEIDQIYT